MITLLIASFTYTHLIDDTRARFSARLPGRLAVVALAANASRPVAIYVPRGFRPDAPARLVLYFHGVESQLGRTLTANGLIDRIASFGAQGNAVYVLPQGVAQSRRPWIDDVSFTALEREAIAVATQLAGAPITVSARTIIAHSAGGKAVALAARRGELRADKLVLLDCFYGWWHDAIADDIAAKSIDVTYYRSTNDPALAAAFFRRVRGVHHVTQVSHHDLPGAFSSP